MNRFAFAGICGLFACAAAAPVTADDYYEYGDWRLSVGAVDTGEDIRVTCRASTGGDGDPVLSMTVSNGDAGPPDFYPDVVLSEHAVRGFDTMLQDGETVTFVADDGDSMTGTARRWVNDEGFIEAQAMVEQSQTLFALQAMERAGQFEIVSGGRLIYTASFHGFRDAYSHMMSACGFSTEGVIAAYEGYEVEQAPTEFFHYKSWHVMIQDTSNTEHSITTCLAYTGTEGTTGITISTEMRDGEPPFTLPSILIGDAPLEEDGATPADASIYVSFDDGRGLAVDGQRWIDANGALQANALFYDDRLLLPLLRAMRGGREIYVSTDDRLVARHSLMGFTAAYGKIAEQCRFSADNVIR